MSISASSAIDTKSEVFAFTSDTKNLNVKGIISMINITRYLQTLLLYALWGVITLIII